ncbi:MAG: GDSL-type esterase/lipase family protein [Vicinamibacterales bacterium]
MPLSSRLRGASYPDVAALALAALWSAIALTGRGAEAAPPWARDWAGVWTILLAVALWVASRRTRSDRRGMLLLAAGTCALVGLGVRLWRWGVTPFAGGLTIVLLLLAAGASLRTRPLGERLTRVDWFGLVTAVAGVVLSLVMTEAALRVGAGAFRPEIQQLMRIDPRQFGVPHPEVGYLHRPNEAIELFGKDFHAVHHVDGLGFRNAWPWPATADVVTIGDSLTFGYGVADDEAWPSVVRDAIGPRRLINLGLIGASPQQYERLFTTFGARLRPRVVIVGFFARNDFWDTAAFDDWLALGAGGNYLIWRDFGRPRYSGFSPAAPVASAVDVARVAVYRTLKRSYLYNLLGVLHGAGGGDTARDVYTTPGGAELLLSEGEFLAQSRLGRRDTREFRLAVEALQRLQAETTAGGARLLVVLLPGKEEVYLPLLGTTPPDPTADLRTALDARGIAWFDLAPSFKAHARDGEQLFFEVDGHPNPAGQALIAHEVIDRLGPLLDGEAAAGVGAPSAGPEAR